MQLADFRNHAVLGKLAKKRRERLFEWLQWNYSEHMRIQVISGSVPFCKAKDRDSIALLAFDPARQRVFFLTDKPVNETPEVFLSGEIGFQDLGEFLTGTSLPFRKRKESPGRPPKYGEAEADEIHRLRMEGMTFRAIASHMHMSTSTIQKLLKRW